MKIKVKPMSMNAAYRGRRFKSNEYKQYREDVLKQLRPVDLPDGPLELYMQIGVSNKGFDIDNCAKPFIDILQEKYGFNDNRIYHLNIVKRITPKGEEFVSFSLHGLSQ